MGINTFSKTAALGQALAERFVANSREKAQKPTANKREVTLTQRSEDPKARQNQPQIYADLRR
jgi:hypothetical protein